MVRGKTQELTERISSDSVDEGLLKKIKDQWLHDDFRKRFLDLASEHEKTTDFEDAVARIIARYQKMKNAERILWIAGIIASALAARFL